MIPSFNPLRFLLAPLFGLLVLALQNAFDLHLDKCIV